MLFAAAGVRPHNIDSVIQLWPGHAGGTTRLYAFEQKFEEFPIIAEVTIARGTTKLAIDSVFVRNKCKAQDSDTRSWYPLGTWLLELPLPTLLTEGTIRAGVQRILHCQQTWWKKTGKGFSLMNLPAEIRAIVFRYALGGDIHLRHPVQ